MPFSSHNIDDMQNNSLMKSQSMINSCVSLPTVGRGLEGGNVKILLSADGGERGWRGVSLVKILMNEIMMVRNIK
jgi:hypothetical protein